MRCLLPSCGAPRGSVAAPPRMLGSTHDSRCVSLVFQVDRDQLYHMFVLLRGTVLCVVDPVLMAQNTKVNELCSGGIWIFFFRR